MRITQAIGAPDLPDRKQNRRPSLKKRQGDLHGVCSINRCALLNAPAGSFSKDIDEVEDGRVTVTRCALAHFGMAGFLQSVANVHKNMERLRALREARDALEPRTAETLAKKYARKFTRSRTS